MMKIMQMQQQETQQMQMNFVQAQQQQSQLLMHCWKNILNDWLLASKFLGIESDIYTTSVVMQTLTSCWF